MARTSTPATRRCAAAVGAAVVLSLGVTGPPALAGTATAAGAVRPQTSAQSNTPESASVSAQSQSPQAQKEAVDAALEALQDDLVGTSSELTDAYAEYAAVQEQLPGARQAADVAAEVQRQAQAAADDLASRLIASQVAEDAAALAVAETEKEMEDSHAAIGRLAASTYRSSRVPPGLALAMGARDSAELASQSAALSSLVADQERLFEHAATDQAVRSSAATRLGAVGDQIADLQAQAREQLAVAEQAAEQAAQRRAEAEQLAARQQAAVSTIEGRQAEEQARLDQLQAESDSLGAQLREIAEADQARAAAASQSRPRSQGGSQGGDAGSSREPSAQDRSARDNGATLRRPEGRITSPFGMRLHPIRKVMRLHSGQDFASGCGNPIRAAEDGEIVSAGYNGGYGNIIVVNHGLINGESVATAYPHLSGFAKTSGPVTRGEVIGYEGTTGSSTGCHLHFEVRVNGSAVDPMGWI